MRCVVEILLCCALQGPCTRVRMHNTISFISVLSKLPVQEIRQVNTQKRSKLDFTGPSTAAMFRKCVFFSILIYKCTISYFIPTRSDKSSLSQQQANRPTACHSSTLCSQHHYQFGCLPHDFSEFRSPSNRSPAI